MRKGNKRSKGSRMKGGSNYGTGGGGAGWTLSNFGTGAQQWLNTFGPNSLGINTGNLLPTIAGAPAVLPGMTPQGSNPPSQLLKMFGGRRGRSGRRRKTKGGMGMLATAAVPLTLLALQQSYGTRKNGSRRRGSRRRGSRRRGSRRR